MHQNQRAVVYRDEISSIVQESACVESGIVNHTGHNLGNYATSRHLPDNFIPNSPTERIDYLVQPARPFSRIENAPFRDAMRSYRLVEQVNSVRHYAF
jgi:hypothetical protein